MSSFYLHIGTGVPYLVTGTAEPTVGTSEEATTEASTVAVTELTSYATDFSTEIETEVVTVEETTEVTTELSTISTGIPLIRPDIAWLLKKEERHLFCLSSKSLLFVFLLFPISNMLLSQSSSCTDFSCADISVITA